MSWPKPASAIPPGSWSATAVAAAVVVAAVALGVVDMADVAQVVLARAFGGAFVVGIEDKAEVVELDILVSDEQGRVVEAVELAAVLVRLPSLGLRYRLGPLGVGLGRWRRRVEALV